MYIVKGFSLWFMNSIASRLELTVITGKMGPKISSWRDKDDCECDNRSTNLHDWFVRADPCVDGGGDVKLLLVHLPTNLQLALGCRHQTREP